MYRVVLLQRDWLLILEHVPIQPICYKVANLYTTMTYTPNTRISKEYALVIAKLKDPRMIRDCTWTRHWKYSYVLATTCLFILLHLTLTCFRHFCRIVFFLTKYRHVELVFLTDNHMTLMESPMQTYTLGHKHGGAILGPTLLVVVLAALLLVVEFRQSSPIKKTQHSSMLGPNKLKVMRKVFKSEKNDLGSIADQAPTIPHYQVDMCRYTNSDSVWNLLSADPMPSLLDFQYDDDATTTALRSAQENQRLNNAREGYEPEARVECTDKQIDEFVLVEPVSPLARTHT